MKNSIKQRKIYGLKDYSIDFIVEQHVKRLKQLKKIEPLKEKFTYLIHQIINRYFSNGRAMACLNAEALQYVFGKECNGMLQTLLHIDLLDYSGYYIPNETSYAYAFKPQLEYTYSLHPLFYLSKYADKMENYMDKFKKEEEMRNRKHLDNDTLYSRYNDALSSLKLIYEEEAIQFVSLHSFISNNSRLYYHYITPCGDKSTNKS